MPANLTSNVTTLRIDDKFSLDITGWLETNKLHEKLAFKIEYVDPQTYGYLILRPEQWYDYNPKLA